MPKKSTTNEKRAKGYLLKPYARVVIPEEDGSFRAEIIEFPGCLAIGNTAAEAIGSLEDTAIDWLVAALENNQPIPPPIDVSNDYSGKLVLRIPKSLHKKASWIAEREGVSLNQLISTSLSEAVGEFNATVRMTLVNLTASVTFGPEIAARGFAFPSAIATTPIITTNFVAASPNA